MELLKVTKDGALHFKLSDGRIGASYTSGYVRVSTKSPNNYYKNIRMYQINKKKSYTTPINDYTFYQRELLPLQQDRLNHLINFNNKNCK
tara:strand:+ start:504 stop:773 length:270 start_codon:yes stop_codon:yes gene_type:complete